jgi:hypothetical protein
MDSFEDQDFQGGGTSLQDLQRQQQQPQQPRQQPQQQAYQQQQQQPNHHPQPEYYPQQEEEYYPEYHQQQQQYQHCPKPINPTSISMVMGSRSEWIEFGVVFVLFIILSSSTIYQLESSILPPNLLGFDQPPFILVLFNAVIFIILFIILKKCKAFG